MENNTAKLFDLRGFNKIQDLMFPSHIKEFHQQNKIVLPGSSRE